MKVHVQLNFGGNCEEAFRFYEKHLGGKITVMMKMGEMPDQSMVPPEMKNKIAHTRMTLAGMDVIGNDTPADTFKPIHSSYLLLEVDSPKAADDMYAVLKEGGRVGMPIAETFFATRFAQLRDRFGILWTIIHAKQM